MKTGTKPATAADHLARLGEVLMVLEEGARECPELVTPDAVAWLVGVARGHLVAAQGERRPKRATRQAL